MSDFKHYRDNKSRYNIYESHVEVIERKSFYVPLRNILFTIALLLSIFVTSLISFDSYKNTEDKASRMLIISHLQQNQVKDEITELNLNEIISNTIIQKLVTDDSIESINPYQLKRIIQHVMEKIDNTHNQIIYTQK